MLANKIITLLSDFGLSDVYVGVMKGVIAQINPALTVIDLTHQIPPQDIAAARFSIMNAYPYFPDGTVHVAVVDPGVGSHRRAIAVQLDAGFLVGPDNGLFSGVLSQTKVVAAVELTNSQYWRTATPSTTFHGRDIFAAVGAHLASSVPLEVLGDAIAPETLVQLKIPERIPTDNSIVGCIQYIDRFGNLVTNIPATDVWGKTWSVAVAESPTQTLPERSIPSSQTYSDRPLGEVVALIGSHGWVEIAVNGGSAQSQLQMDVGASMKVLLA
jgi:S-adenosyl-L-methionine hydrolase (adenosine-forming)